ncbi:MAG: GAF and ANTAR domain-containing protein [Nocardioidaceae bacterium]
MASPPTRALRPSGLLRARVLAAMAVAAPGKHESGITDVLGRLCRTLVVELSVSGAAVNVMGSDPAAQAVAGSSDPRSARLDDLQFTTGEGPCHEAFSSRRPVLVADLVNEPRWPGYCAAALDHGVRAVFAFPLQVGAVRLGVLDVYSEEARSLSELALALALAFAEIATESLLSVGSPGHRTTLEPGLGSSLGSRAQIYQAQGMVMVEHEIPLVDALVRMRGYAFAHQRSLSDVAEEIVGGRLRLERDPVLS